MGTAEHNTALRALVAPVVFLVLLMGPGFAEDILTWQSAPSGSDYVGGAVGVSPTNFYSQGQEFCFNGTGNNITRVEMRMRTSAGTPGDPYLTIYNSTGGVPSAWAWNMNGAIKGCTAFVPSFVDGSHSNKSFNFSDCQLEGELCYITTMNTTDASPGGSHQYYRELATGANPYPNGSVSWWADYATWVPDATKDTVFWVWADISPPVAPTGVTMLRPENTTYFNETTVLEFSYVTGNNASGGYCWLYNDTIAHDIGNVANATTNMTLWDVDQGVHNATIICDDGTTIASNTTHFTYSIFGVIERPFFESVYETNDTTFNMTLGFNDDVAEASALFFLNGSLVSSVETNFTQYGYTAAYYLSAAKIPLIPVNDTNHSLIWQLTVNYTNGTSSTFNDTTVGLPTWFSYYPLNFSAPGEAIQGQPLNLDTYATELFSVADVLVNVTLFNEVFTSSKNGFYRSTESAPTLPAGIFNRTVRSNSTLYANYSGVQYSRFSVNNDTLVYKPAMVLCGGLSSAVALNFSFFDEENVTRENADMDATFWAWDLSRSDNTTTSLNFTNVSYAEVCIYPNFTTLLIDSFQYYDSTYTNSSDIYPLRAYFLDNATVSNVTSNVSLFMELSSLAKLVTVSVKDTNFQALTGGLISFLRYDAANNSYSTMAMVLTDSSGGGNTYLRPNDVWYRIIVTKGHVVQQIFEPRTIACAAAAGSCPITLNLAPSFVNEYFQYYNQVAFSCTNTSELLRCTVSDTSGLMQYARLRVWEIGLYAPIPVCDANSTSSSSILICNFGNTTGKSFTYSLVGHFNEETMLTQGMVAFEGGLSAFSGAGGMPVFGGLLVISVAMVGIANPAVAIILSLAGLVLSVMLGVLSISWYFLAGIIVVGLIFVVKMRRVGGEI